MNVTCVPLTEFVHGRITAHAGRPIVLSEHVAADLERAGLIRVQFVPPQPPIRIKNAAGATIEIYEGTRGKSRDDGKGQPSSASPAAPVLTTKTSLPSRPGGKMTPAAKGGA